MKLVTAADVWYTQQQKTLDEIAEKLGVVAYRPSYHGAERDKNTVLFYLKEDEEHNREVDRQPVRYSRSEAKDRGVNVNSECVYRDHFWSFENSGANGQLDMGWANWTGRPSWKAASRSHLPERCSSIMSAVPAGIWNCEKPTTHITTGTASSCGR